MTERANLVRQAEQLRDSKLLAVHGKYGPEIETIKLRLLERMRASPDREVGADDLPDDHRQKYKGNAPYVGAAVRAFAKLPYVSRSAIRKSARRPRHGNEIKVWRWTGTDAQLDALIEESRKRLPSETTTPTVTAAGVGGEVPHV